MDKLLYVGLGGFCGSLARYGLALLYPPGIGALPLATLGANLLGSFFIGLLSALFLDPGLHPGFRLYFIVGLLGGFTTFSSFSLETIKLLQTGNPGKAIFYVLTSVLGGLALTAGGFILGKTLRPD